MFFISNPSPIFTISSGTLLFVCGQYFLRSGLDIKNNYLQLWVIFSCAMALTSLFVFLVTNPNHFNNIFFLQNQDFFLYAMFAGLLFAIGNLFWIYTISTKKSLGSIRVIMAGIETFLLFLLGFLLFAESFTIQKILGIVFILFGIYMVG